MTEKLTVGQLYPTPVAPAARRGAVLPAQTGTSGKSFETILQDNVLRLSHHAELRLKQRGIDLKPEQMAKIQSAIDKAAAKGAKDTLILLNQTALIVNVKNRTIITAMDGANMKDNVFTQIDSAVILS